MNFISLFNQIVDKTEENILKSVSELRKIVSASFPHHEKTLWNAFLYMTGMTYVAYVKRRKFWNMVSDARILEDAYGRVDWEELYDKFGYSRAVFFRQFKEYIGVTPNEILLVELEIEKPLRFAQLVKDDGTEKSEDVICRVSSEKYQRYNTLETYRAMFNFGIGDLKCIDKASKYKGIDLKTALDLHLEFMESVEKIDDDIYEEEFDLSEFYEDEYTLAEAWAIYHDDDGEMESEFEDYCDTCDEY